MRRALRLLQASPGRLGSFLRYGLPRRVLLFGPLSLGDDLLCTTVLREARRRGRPFAMMTSRPELFRDNTDPSALLPVDDYYAQALGRLGARVIQPHYAGRDPSNPLRDVFEPHHILTEMCRLAGITGEISLRPYLHLPTEEQREGRIFPRQITVQSSCRLAAFPFTTKEWGAERLVAVARALAGGFKLIQVGAPDDPPLPVDLDLRGRTRLRETAAILSASEAFVGLEGFLSHLARAVDCSAVVIIGGRVRPETVGYACNVNLYSAVDCAPCGLRDGCPHAMKCMTAISPETGAAAARELAQRRPVRPLPADATVIP